MRKTLLNLLLMVFFFTIASIQAQAYFGLPYAGYGNPYNTFGYPYYGSGIGIPYYGGIFGSPYVTSPPPDLSGWTWTSPTTATSPPFPDGTSAAVSVDFAAGYEGSSPYYQQNDGLGSSIGTSPSIYDQYYGWNQPYQAQAYFGFPYAGYGVPYNMFGYPSYGSGIGIPYSGIGIPYYGGIFGSPYVTSPPPDLSGWTWTGPTTAEYPLPGGGSSMIFVSPAAGYEWLSPYYQQNDDLDSSIGTSSSIYDQYYGWNQPYYGYSWIQPYI